MQGFLNQMSQESSQGFEPTPLRFSQSAIQHSTNYTTRVLWGRGRQSLTWRLPRYQGLLQNFTPLISTAGSHHASLDLAAASNRFSCNFANNGTGSIGTPCSIGETGGGDLAHIPLMICFYPLIGQV